MKREEILAMKPGERLDRVVALRVMGYEESKTMKGWVRMGALATYPKRYSTDISAAWEVVRRISKDYGVNVYEEDGAPCECTLVRYPETVAVVGGSSAPEVICKAALLAVLEDINLPGEETE